MRKHQIKGRLDLFYRRDPRELERRLVAADLLRDHGFEDIAEEALCLRKAIEYEVFYRSQGWLKPINPHLVRPDDYFVPLHNRRLYRAGLDDVDIIKARSGYYFVFRWRKAVRTGQLKEYLLIRGLEYDERGLPTHPGNPVREQLCRRFRSVSPGLTVRLNECHPIPFVIPSPLNNFRVDRVDLATRIR